MKSYSEHIRLKGMSSEHGSVPVLPTDRDQMACACRAERILHIFGNAGVIAEQDAREERGLRFGQDLRDDVLGARLERVEPPEWSKTLIAREHRHAWARHERIHILTSQILAIRKIACVGRRLEFALGADAVAIAKIGERRRLNEH